MINKVLSLFKLSFNCLHIATIEIYLHTPQVPPFLEQCLQYLQFLHALQFLDPVHVALIFGGITE